jgi:hypothetical protein
VEEVRHAAEAEGIVVSSVDKDADDALARKVADMLAEIAAPSVGLGLGLGLGLG